MKTQSKAIERPNYIKHSWKRRRVVEDLGTEVRFEELDGAGKPIERATTLDPKP